MTNNTSAIVDEFVERIKAARDVAVLTLTVVTALQNLLGALAMWHNTGDLAEDMAEAEELARKALELWDRFWSIEVSPAGE